MEQHTPGSALAPRYPASPLVGASGASLAVLLLALAVLCMHAVGTALQHTVHTCGQMWLMRCRAVLDRHAHRCTHDTCTA